MIDWLFSKYDSNAYGIFRISFYSIILWFYYSYFGLEYENWLVPEFSTYFEPISFFSIFSFSDFKILSDIPLLLIWKISMFFCIIGLLFPISSIIAFFGLLIMAGLPLNFGKIHHVNHMPVVILGIMAFSFTAGGFSVDRLFFKKWMSKITVTTWALRTAQVYMSLVYFASGYQKLNASGLDWIFSDNMQTILVTRSTVTPLGLWIAQFPMLCKMMALVTVVAQLSAPVALISLRWRLFVVPTLFMLHVGTYIAMGDHGFFVPYNLCYLIWIPWQRIFNKSSFMYSGAKAFESCPYLGRVVQLFYIHLLFPIMGCLFRLKHGTNIEFHLRHSILKSKFNPFLSDIDFSVVVPNNFQGMKKLVADLWRLNGVRIFDVAQVYRSDEWRLLQSFDANSKSLVWFVWNFRKYVWLTKTQTQNKYEELKKQRAVKKCLETKYSLPEMLELTMTDLGVKTSQPSVCLYSSYLELTTSQRIIETDDRGFSFILSLLPGEKVKTHLNSAQLDLKRSLWIHEYLLSRSHLRMYSLGVAERDHYKRWIRFLENEYFAIFSANIVASGEENDMDGEK